MSSREQPAQLGLFPGSAHGARLGPARHPVELRALARALPRHVCLGTSSWSFPGWRGLVYDRAASAAVLARQGLAAYARHPLLRGVGIDRGYYAPIAVETFRAYADAVPADFRFLVKAPEACTLAVASAHPRHAGAAGVPNPLYLDASYAAQEVVAPFVDGLGERAGALVFQFPPQDPQAAGGPAFAERLHRFLAALPRGPRYAVELRMAGWLRPDVRDALAAAGALPCLSVYPRLPALDSQARRLGAEHGAALVVRWNLHGRQRYAEARERYAPFDRLIDEDSSTRARLARLCSAHAAAGHPVFVAINNKAEGCAPLSVVALARAIVAREASGRASRKSGAARTSSGRRAWEGDGR